VRGIGRRSAATRLLGGAVGAVEQGDGMLAMIAGRGAELIQDARLRMPRCQGIARAEGAHIFASSGRGHRGLRARRVRDGAR
jgi:hypothetical protein